jgi:molybdopterin-guanine dinucleotide biosynthesis protein A
MTATAVTGIILAGGEGKRMGTFKPLVPYRGKPLIAWVFEEMSAICGPMVIIANSGDFSAFNAAVFPDNYPGIGPAAGIEAGLSHCQTPLALFCSCDTPNLSSGFFRYLVENHGDYDISIPVHEGITEPLNGVFSRRIHSRFEKAILAGDPHPPRIIRQCHWQEIPVGPEQNFYRPDLFLNLNRPSDLTR